MVIQGIVTALSVGMGCGTCCGSAVSAFLFGYLTSHAGKMRHSVKAFLSFYLGKILAVAAVCVASSLLGSQLMDENGMIGRVSIRLLVDLCMIVLGAVMIIRWVWERTHPGCQNCHHCSSEKGKTQAEKGPDQPEERKVSYLALALVGGGYGISPCAPLVMMAGYAATITPVSAFLAGSVFAASSAFVPMLLLLVLSGVLTARLYKEIPQYLVWFRLLSYLLLIGIFTADLIQAV